MAVHKLALEDFQEDDFALIAIHSNEHDYRLAYALNNHLSIALKRNDVDVDFQYNKASFPVFEWYQEQRQTTWNLVSNSCITEEQSTVSAGTLFTDSASVTRTFHLLPEFKAVDYLLKISCETASVNQEAMTQKLIQIPEVRMAYAINTLEIHSRSNLIFK